MSSCRFWSGFHSCHWDLFCCEDIGKQLGIFFFVRILSRPPSCDILPSWKFGGKNVSPRGSFASSSPNLSNSSFLGWEMRNINAQGRAATRQITQFAGSNRKSPGLLLRWLASLLVPKTQKRFATWVAPAVHQRLGGNPTPPIDGADLLAPSTKNKEKCVKTMFNFGRGGYLVCWNFNLVLCQVLPQL